MRAAASFRIAQIESKKRVVHGRCRHHSQIWLAPQIRDVFRTQIFQEIDFVQLEPRYRCGKVRRYAPYDVIEMRAPTVVAGVGNNLDRRAAIPSPKAKASAAYWRGCCSVVKLFWPDAGELVGGKN